MNAVARPGAQDAQQPKQVPRQRKPAQRSQIVLYLVLTLGALISAFPFVYMVMTSLKSYGSVVSGNLWPWPPLGTEAIQWQNYSTAIQTIGIDRSWQIPMFFRYTINSLLVSGLTVAGLLL